MPKYIRKPIIVEAIRWFPELGSIFPGIYAIIGGNAAIIIDGAQFIIEPGDWCVRGPDMKVSVYTSEEFHKLYEEVFPGYKGQ